MEQSKKKPSIPSFDKKKNRKNTMPRLNGYILFITVSTHLIPASLAFTLHTFSVTRNLSNPSSTSLHGKPDDDTISSSIVSILTSGVNFVMGDKGQEVIASGKHNKIRLFNIIIM